MTSQRTKKGDRRCLSLRRRLRSSQTPAEQKLWHALKSIQFKNLKFRRQHGIGPYIVDFFCASRRLVLEVDGDVHVEKKQIEKDKKREGYLKQRGVRIIRYQNNQILGNFPDVLEDLFRQIETLPPPTPPYKGGGFNKFFFLIFFLCLHCGSGLEPLGFDALVDKQPKVLSVTPVDGESRYDGTTVEVVFSKPIDSKTVSAKSFLVVPVAEGSVDVQALWKQAQDNKLTPSEGSYEISPDGLTVRFHSLKSFPPKVRCGVLVTPKLFSQEQLPFNQTPGSGPNPFFSSFYAEGIASESETVVDDKSSSGTSPPVPTPALPKSIYLKLNEIFYDAAGVDTEGDLFIELTGEPEHDISGYQINMVRGSDGKIMDTIKIPAGIETNSEGLFVIADAITGQPGMTKVIPADFVTSFDPPNGPDCIQLVDPSGKLADAVGYGSPLVLRGENNLLCYEGLPGPDAPSGKSISRKPETFDSDNNAQDWVVNNTPTPGSVEVK